MSKFKGTKGPWFMDGSAPFVDNEEPIGFQNTGTFGIRTKAKKGHKNKVTDISAYEFWGLTIPEAQANALLISKAPEMLEMLEDILNVIDWSTEHWQGNGGKEREQKIKQLIKSATEL